MAISCQEGRKLNKLVKQETNDAGEVIYKMVTFDIDVIAKSTGGLAPTIIYMHKEEDITDDIRALRFHFENPANFIEDYPAFQAMLFQKEQLAIERLYEKISIKPKNMPVGKQILWNFFVIFLILLPFIVVVLFVK